MKVQWFTGLHIFMDAIALLRHAGGTLICERFFSKVRSPPDSS